jgi:hypothetical protein
MMSSEKGKPIVRWGHKNMGPDKQDGRFAGRKFKKILEEYTK